MKKRFHIDPIPLIFTMIVVGFLTFLINKALMFGLSKYDEYWQEHNISYGRDLKFFGVKQIDQDKKPADSKLRENALALVNAHLNGKTAENCGSDIAISEKFFKKIDPNYNVTKPLDSWCSLGSFLVVQKGEKAIIAFEYSVIPKNIEEAEQYCRDTFKTRKTSRIYLERTGGQWTVTDVLVVQ